MFLFVLVLFFLMFCTALPPSRWGLRIWLAAAVPLGTFLLMLPETPPDDLDWAGELFEAMVILAILALFVGVVARWLILGGKETQPPSPPEVRGLRIMDIGLAMLAGYCGGVILTLALALALRGFPGGILLHHGVSVLAIVAALLVLYRARGPVHVAFAAAFLVLAYKVYLGAHNLPDQIAMRSKALGPDVAQCFFAGDRPATREDMMLLTLPLGRPGSPGLVLALTSPSGTIHYRWSYRAHAFIPLVIHDPNMRVSCPG